VYSFNERVQKRYEKSGFKIIGKRREALSREDIRHGTFYTNKIIKQIENHKDM
jgi:RimJ/RimL family protein N-acetyltransferase